LELSDGRPMMMTHIRNLKVVLLWIVFLSLVSTAQRLVPAFEVNRSDVGSSEQMVYSTIRSIVQSVRAGELGRLLQQFSRAEFSVEEIEALRLPFANALLANRQNCPHFDLIPKKVTEHSDEKAGGGG
jgi:hypothetical protein